MTTIFEPPVLEPRKELTQAITAAIEAGKEIMEVYSTEFETSTKDDDSPITLADLKSNESIKRILSKSNYWILSEEDSDDPKRLSENLIWIIDPLDGTTDFVNRTGEFTVMIALVEDKKPVIGVIFWPTKGILYIAQKNCGAFRFKDGKWSKINVSNISELTNCRAVGSRHHLSEQEKSLLEVLQISNFSSIGSSFKVGLISSGEAEIYLTTTNKMKEWDSCASYCIVNEAGGTMTDMNGDDLTYNNPLVNHENGILVTNGLVHEIIVEEFKKLK